MNYYQIHKMNECMWTVVFHFKMHHGNLKGRTMQAVKKPMKGRLRASKGSVWEFRSRKFHPEKLPPRKLSPMKIVPYENTHVWKLMPMVVPPSENPPLNVNPKKIVTYEIPNFPPPINIVMRNWKLLPYGPYLVIKNKTWWPV